MANEIPNFGPIPQDKAFRAILETQIAIMDALDTLVICAPTRQRIHDYSHEALQQRQRATQDLLAVYRGGEEKPAESAKPEPAPIRKDDGRYVTEEELERLKSIVSAFLLVPDQHASRVQLVRDTLNSIQLDKVSDARRVFEYDTLIKALSDFEKTQAAKEPAFKTEVERLRYAARMFNDAWLNLATEGYRVEAQFVPIHGPEPKAPQFLDLAIWSPVES